MKKYSVPLEVAFNVSIDVVAENKKEAIEKARKQLYQKLRTGDYDTGYLDNPYIYDDVPEDDVFENK